MIEQARELVLRQTGVCPDALFCGADFYYNAALEYRAPKGEFGDTSDLRLAAVVLLIGAAWPASVTVVLLSWGIGVARYRLRKRG